MPLDPDAPPMPAEDPSAALRAALGRLRQATQERRPDELGEAVEAVRRLDPDHPHMHLAHGLLLRSLGRPHDAVAPTIRGYERLINLRGDPAAANRLDALLQAMRQDGNGHVMMRPAALVSKNAAVLRLFVQLACDGGHFQDADEAARRLRELTGQAWRDAEDAIAIGMGVTTVFTPPPDVAVTLPAGLEPGTLHHSLVVPGLIVQAARTIGLDASAGPLLAALDAFGIFSDASAHDCLNQLLRHGADACALRFYDAAEPRLSLQKRVEMLDDAIGSAILRGKPAAFNGYQQRFAKATGCRTGGLTRLASHVGVNSRKAPGWSPILDEFYRIAATQAAAQATSRSRTASGAGAPPFRIRQLAEARPVQPQSADGKIDVFLKCVKRPFDIQPFVSFWMECFGRSDRYRIRLLDDTGLDLKQAFPQHAIHDSRSLRAGRNLAQEMIGEARRPLNMLGWESIANLTPFMLSDSEWFWNIDADDIAPMLDLQSGPDLVRSKLEEVEVFSRRSGVMAMSYDLWASVHYLLNHSYHWTFGISLCRKDPPLLDRLLTSFAGVDLPIFRINIDHLFSRLSDGSLAQGAYADLFASFVFNGVRVLQLDPQGNRIHHGGGGLSKRLSFHEDDRLYVQQRLHGKTLIV
ncbi:hypothetical protein [Azospirillum picis]|uniref:Uncharacterized protein n=1 Tax=Azospirillum picis TaxID=488438 RepID=A0ABU0MD56_9PROT|nr:hypothetical protein [Azospirillum picis]MBP2297606.1 hypothetical protein [Azospirillum picis]MDQ0531371.1 hypothetical protein [Azospirillum picis]